MLSRYRLLEEVGRGGMAVVYRGVDTLLQRDVAVKVLHPHLADLAESRARLEREAQAVAKLRHDNILEIFDFAGPDSSDRFIVTEFIHGETLTAFLAHHRLALPEIAEMILVEVTGALEHAHAAGIIHRDVKPENVMIRRDGMLKLTDFGIAQIVDKEKLTVTGQLLGSPAYMAPEHVEGGAIDFRTDVFAAGILLYQLATGELPFRGKNPHQVLKKIAECQYVPPDQVNPQVGTRLRRIICRALARRPEDRYPAVAAMRAELLADLADAGLDEPRRQLVRFFNDPEPETERLRDHIVDALTARGRVHAAEGRPAAALALWARALTYAPDRADVQALVDGLARRRRNGRLAALAGATLLAAGGAALAVQRLLAPAPPSTPVLTAAVSPPATSTLPPTALPASVSPASVSPASVSPSSVSPTSVSPSLVSPTPVSTTSVSPAAVTPVAATTSVPPPTPQGRTPLRPPPVRRPPAHAGTRAVTIHTIPKNVDIFVDGQFAASYSGPPIQVAPGAHELTFRSPSGCCADAKVRIGADDTASPLVRLVWKSARLLVATQPAQADIVYTTSKRATPQVARGGQSISIAIPAESETGEVDVHLSVSAPGHVSRELDVKARAGQVTRPTVELARSP